MNPGVPVDVDEQRRLVRRARAQGRHWVLRGVLLAVIGAAGFYRGGSVNVTIGVACCILALLSISLGRRTRRQAAELERKMELMASGGQGTGNGGRVHGGTGAPGHGGTA